MEPRILLAALLFALALPAIATAQELGEGFGLALTEETSSASSAQPSLGLDLSEPFPLSRSEGVLSEGPPVVAVPPGRADGLPDVEIFKLLHAGLAERLGDRLIGVDATLAAIASERLDSTSLATARGTWCSAWVGPRSGWPSAARRRC
jgi:hypothetical protein